MWSATIGALLEQGKVHQEGQKRGTRYRLAVSSDVSSGPDSTIAGHKG
jgi:hypothetical protein